jgi:hypothetical protein
MDGEIKSMVLGPHGFCPHKGWRVRFTGSTHKRKWYEMLSEIIVNLKHYFINGQSLPPTQF